MLDIFFIFSLSTLLLSAIGCVIWSIVIRITKSPRAPLVNPINTFLLFAVIAFFLLFVPNALRAYDNDVVVSSVSAFFDMVDGLSFGNSVADMFNRVFEHVDGVSRLYVLYALFVIVLMPLLAMRTVLAVFRDFFTQISYLLSCRKKYHIFSELNGKSIILAEDIAQKDEKAHVIFTSVDKSAAERLYIERARRINALLTNKTISGFKISTAAAKNALYLYFVGEDEKKNINLALDKFERIKNSERETVVYLFSTDNSAERFVDLANSQKNNPKVKMQLFNEAQRIAYNLIYEHPVCDVETDGKNINVMVLGASSLGLEVAKAISWSSQMMNYTFSIRLFDIEQKNEKLAFPFSGAAEKLKKIGTTLDIEFFDCDIFSQTFDHLRFKEVNYIIIDLGDDSSNITAALQMREIYARQEKGGAYAPSSCCPPKIITITKDEETKKIVNALGDPMIIPYGTMYDLFSAKNVNDWKIDKAGEYLHACYYSFNYIKNNPDKAIDAAELITQGIKDYAVQTELNKRSSRAAAIHCKYKLFDIGINPDKDSMFTKEADALVENCNETMLRCEHDRWNVFQILDGWEPWDKNRLVKGKRKDNYAKLHAYLAEFDELKPIAEFLYGENEDPIEYDRMVVSFSRFALEYAESGDIRKEDAQRLLAAFAQRITAK